MSPAPFQSSREHLEAELAWLDQALWFMVQRFHESDSESAGQGWFLPRSRVESWLLPRPASEETLGMKSQLRLSRDLLDARCAASAEAAVPLPLALAADRLGLMAAERLCLLVCLAGDLNSKYGKTYAYLHDNLTRSLPSLGLVEDLAEACGFNGGSAIPLCSNLWKWSVVVSGEAEPAGDRMSRGLRLDSGVRTFLMESTAEPDVSIKFQVEDDTVQRISAMARRPGRKLLIEIHGSSACDGRGTAAAIANSLGLTLFGKEIYSSDGHEALKQAMLEALIRGSVLFAGGLSSLPDDSRNAVLHAAEPLLAEGPQIVFLQLEKPWFPSKPIAGVDLVPIEMHTPGYPQRLSHWTKLLATSPIGTEELAGIASRYRLSFTEIDAIVRSARTAAELRGGSGASPDLNDLVDNCRLRCRGTLGPGAQLITPRQSWNALVLPTESMEHLREVCGHVRRRTRVLHDWGFHDRLSTGHGLYVLFAGPSGTGKTLAAEVIAHELKVELLRVDLSGVISKYIGETEKNLERVFAAAERSDAILFFDEADALFGKRSEVKDAHDRYANIEINYLLQRLETFEGAAILATNFAQNIDQSFSRRIQLTVEFPFPDEKSRLAIWRSHVPEQTPVSDSLDFEYMARNFEIAGGNIRNIVLNAAFLAADAERSLGMEHLLQAMRREYEKMGKPYRPGEARSLAVAGKER